MPQIERFYPVGTPGQPWGEAERAQWRARQQRQRSHAEDVVDAVEHLRTHLDVQPYGQLDYAPDSYPLLALASSDWDDGRPVALVTGGVHGYETSGVMGALKFAREHVDDYAGRLNLLVVPCVSPWGYERIQRWNAGAVDPNRSLREHSPAMEAAALMHLVAPLAGRTSACWSCPWARPMPSGRTWRPASSSVRRKRASSTVPVCRNSSIRRAS